MNRSNLDLWVGIFVAIGLGAILFLALRVGNLVTFRSEPGYHLNAQFDNIGGLKMRAPVKAAGVVVGRVERIRLDPKTYQGLVRLEIDNYVKFPKDTSAKILTSGLLGDQYIGLEPGADEKELADRDVIKQTQSAVVLENLIGQLIFNRAADAGSGSPTPAEPAPKK